MQCINPSHDSAAVPRRGAAARHRPREFLIEVDEDRLDHRRILNSGDDAHRRTACGAGLERSEIFTNTSRNHVTRPGNLSQCVVSALDPRRGPPGCFDPGIIASFSNGSRRPEALESPSLRDRQRHTRSGLFFEVSVIPRRNASPGNSLGDRAQDGANSETASYLRRWFQKKGEGGAGIRGVVLGAIGVPADTMTID